MREIYSDKTLEDLEVQVRELIKERDRLATELEKSVDRSLKAQTSLLLDLIELKDEFERVFTNIEPRLELAEKQAKIWAGNFRTIKRSLEKRLKERGVALIESPEGKAIPGYHTVVETKENLDLPERTILEILLPGYLWQGRTLRQAQVTTVKNT